MMREEIVKHKKYYTNIIDQARLEICRKFFSDGCTSYAISFDNESDNRFLPDPHRRLAADRQHVPASTAAAEAMARRAMCRFRA